MIQAYTNIHCNNNWCQWFTRHCSLKIYCQKCLYVSEVHC